MDSQRYTKKRTSLVGGAMAKFEGEEAADQFNRRHSSQSTRVRQSIPDIRFDENGMPISTRQLQARSQSIAGSGSLLSHERRAAFRRGSEQIKPSGNEKNVRKLSKKFSLTEEEELKKANFTIPSSTRAGMLGSNRRWSVKPDWMKKRKSSVKEEFIEKNLSNLERLSHSDMSAQEHTSDHAEMESIVESGTDDVPPSGEGEGEANDNSRDDSEKGDSNSDSESSGSSSEESDSSDSNSDANEEVENLEQNEHPDTVVKELNGDSTDMHEEVTAELEKLGDVLTSLTASKPKESGKRKHKSSKKKSKVSKNKNSAKEDDVPPRPPPPPLPVQMCDVNDYPDLVTSDEINVNGDENDDNNDDATILTKYGRQRLFVSEVQLVFKNNNGPLINGIE